MFPSSQARPGRTSRRAGLLLALTLLLPWPAFGQQREEEELRPRFRGFRFAELVDPNADLRGFDPRQVAEAAARAVARLDGVDDPSPDQQMAVTLELFQRFGFDAVEKAAKSGAISPEASQLIAAGRQELISAALKGALARVDPEGRIQIGALDSGNKSSGIASDIDQTLRVLPVEVGGEVTVTETEVIEAFDDAFLELTGGLDPEHFGVESMDGRDFPPDLRARHQSMRELATGLQEVFLSKSENAELYRTEGELSIQAIGRGEAAIREFFEELERRDQELTRRKRAVDGDPAVDDKDAEKRRLDAAHLRWLKQSTPFRTVAWGTDESGSRVPVEHFDRDPRLHGFMEFAPEVMRRFAFDGSFDNWLMYEAHPGNRPKYLIRSVADGIGLLSRLQVADPDAPWRAAPFDYNEVYRQGEEGRARTRAFVQEVYGSLDGTPGGLTTERALKALDTAARARNRHKYGPDEHTDLEIWADYLPENQPGADPRIVETIPDAIRIAAAQSAWEQDARELMIENLLRTVRAPADLVLDGGFDDAEIRALRDRYPDVSLEQLRMRSQLQLFHGIRDLMSVEHARELVRNFADGRFTFPMDGRPEGSNRLTDQADRILAEAARAEGPRAEELKAEIQRIAIDAAASKLMRHPDRDGPTLTLADVRRIAGHVRQRVTDLPGRLSGEARARVERIRADSEAGAYTPERVGRRVLYDLTLSAWRFDAAVANALGFRGEYRLDVDAGEMRVRGVEVEMAGRRWDASAAVRSAASMGNADGAIEILRAYQTGGARAAAEALVREVVLNAPGADQVQAVYDLYANGRWETAFMTAAGMAIPIVGQGYVVVSLATNSVQILGDMVLEPLKNDRLDMAYQGYLGEESGFTGDQRGQRYNVLAPVPIQVIPWDRPRDPAPVGCQAPGAAAVDAGPAEPVPDWVFREYSRDELFDLIDRFNRDPTVGISIETSDYERVYEFGRDHGLIGGGTAWRQALGRAQDWLEEPRLNFEAKRASLFPFFGDEVEAYLAGLGAEEYEALEVDLGVLTPSPGAPVEDRPDLEMLLTADPATVSTVLAGFFRPWVQDWAHGTGSFEGVVDGENELLLPQVDAERNAFFDGLARRMAADFVRSYRILRLQPIRYGQEADQVHNGAVEARMLQTLQERMTTAARCEVTRLTMALGDMYGRGVDPELANAVHAVVLQRREVEGSRARVHVRPRVYRAGTPDEPYDSVAFRVSVVADTTEHPGPYSHRIVGDITEHRLVTAEITVLDRNGSTVGEPVDVEVGTLVDGPGPRVAEEERAIATCALGATAPEDVPDHEAASHCEWDAQPVLEHDHIAVFFTPRRDLSEAGDPFVWLILNPEGNTVTAGSYGVADPESEDPGEAAEATRLAVEGSPGRLAVVLTPGRSWSPILPGTYTVQTATAVADGTGVFGQGVPTARPTGDWVDESTFEIAPSRLHFRGFVVDRVQEMPLPEETGLEDGTLTIVEPRVLGEGEVSVEMEARWRFGYGRDDVGSAAEEQTAHSRLWMRFPTEIGLSDAPMAEIQVRLERLAAGDGPRNRLHLFTAGMGLLVPAGDPPPGRSLVEGEEVPEPWAGPKPGEMRGSRYEFETTGGELLRGKLRWFFPQDRADRREADRIEGTARLYPGRPSAAPIGAPARPVAAHLRDPDALWVIPVKMTLTDDPARSPWRALSVESYAYALYGMEATPYDGPLPGAPVDAGEGPDGNGPGGAVTIIPEVGGPGDPSDPASIDPTHPDAAKLIWQWITLARPPKAVDSDADYRYDQWGDFVIRGPEGFNVRNAPPDDRGARTPVEYVWGKRDILDSVDHCTLGQYVVRSLEGRGIAECRGRYRPSARLADYTDRKADVVRDELEAEGYQVTFRIEREATGEGDALTVVSQRPAAGSRLEPGEEVTLLIRGAYSDAAVAVPDLADARGGDVRERLEALGLNARIEIRAPPLDRSRSLTVLSQDPAPETRIARGDTVRVALYGRFADVAEVPRVVGMKRDSAERAVREAGLTPRVRTAGRPPSEDRADRVTAQEPDEGARVAPGSEVRISALADWTPPVEELRPEEREANCRRRLAELRGRGDESALRGLQQLGRSCPGTPGIGPAISEVQAELDRQRERERERERQRQREREQERQRARCADYVQRGNAAFGAGRLQDAIRIFRMARGEGCRSNPPYDQVISSIERQIAQQQNQRQCGALERQARQALEAGDYDRAFQIAYGAIMNNECYGDGIRGISEKATNCRIAIQSDSDVLIRMHGCRAPRPVDPRPDPPDPQPDPPRPVNLRQPTPAICLRSLTMQDGRTLSLRKGEKSPTGSAAYLCHYGPPGQFRGGKGVRIEYNTNPRVASGSCRDPQGWIASRTHQIRVPSHYAVRDWANVGRQFVDAAARAGIALPCP